MAIVNLVASGGSTDSRRVSVQIRDDGVAPLRMTVSTTGYYNYNVVVTGGAIPVGESATALVYKSGYSGGAPPFTYRIVRSNPKGGSFSAPSGSTYNPAPVVYTDANGNTVAWGRWY